VSKLDLSLIKTALAHMTKGPWRWWTSNSFRRLSSDPSGKDGDVAYGCVHSDGHPDIAISEENMEGIVVMRNHGEALVAEIEKLREALKSILEVSRDRELFVMMGPRGFQRAEQIAKKALEGS